MHGSVVFITNCGCVRSFRHVEDPLLLAGPRWLVALPDQISGVQEWACPPPRIRSCASSSSSCASLESESDDRREHAKYEFVALSMLWNVFWMMTPLHFSTGKGIGFFVMQSLLLYRVTTPLNQPLLPNTDKNCRKTSLQPTFVSMERFLSKQSCRKQTGRRGRGFVQGVHLWEGILIVV